MPLYNHDYYSCVRAGGHDRCDMQVTTVDFMSLDVGGRWMDGWMAWLAVEYLSSFRQDRRHKIHGPSKKSDHRVTRARKVTTERKKVTTESDQRKKSDHRK
ncbi:hypothetical protein ACOMHN_001204 [Nucella lapillus]